MNESVKFNEQLSNEIKIQKQKYYTLGTHPKSSRKIEERDEINTLNTQIHDRSFSCLGTGISIKIGEVKLILWAYTSPFSIMMRSRKYFLHVSKMSG
jgi:hypothetical protein